MSGAVDLMGTMVTNAASEKAAARVMGPWEVAAAAFEAVG